MAGQLSIDADLAAYVRRVSLDEDEVLADLRRETARFPALETMLAMPEEAQFLGLLAATTGARSILEIGTFTGYTTLRLARALPPGGRVVTCEISETWAGIATRYWQRAGVAERVDLRLGDALGTLEDLARRDGPESFDFVFVDADKENSVPYYEHALTLVRPGGLVVLDNTLLFGRVVDPAATDPATLAVAELNARLRDDHRVDISLLTIADGVTIARKRPG
ncbi:O-methyltransferase [Amycolatopsis sp. CA-126428]|uniref:O-methyltransferase n=1 Tax=Amycolatopsis sp. CA-126428 TaxID=2073158 RepID=UPI000CD29D71|nr:class I SAM-dependent methyltransferase [Amycolatopsis sp. CA-126428]